MLSPYKCYERNRLNTWPSFFNKDKVFFFQVGTLILVFSIKSLSHCMCQQNDRSHLCVYSAGFKVWARAYVLHRCACVGPWPFVGLTSASIHSFGHRGNIGQHVESGFWLFLAFVYSKFCLLKFESIGSVKRNWEIRHMKTDKSHTWWHWPEITSKAQTGS